MHPKNWSSFSCYRIFWNGSTLNVTLDIKDNSTVICGQIDVPVCLPTHRPMVAECIIVITIVLYIFKGLNDPRYANVLCCKIDLCNGDGIKDIKSPALSPFFYWYGTPIV